jgi:hypothetical protein
MIATLTICEWYDLELALRVKDGSETHKKNSIWTLSHNIRAGVATWFFIIMRLLRAHD